MLLSNYDLTPLFPSKYHEELRNNVKYNYNTQHLYKYLQFWKPLDISNPICFSPQLDEIGTVSIISPSFQKNRCRESKWLAQESLANNYQMLTMTQVLNSGVNIPPGTLVLNLRL